MQVAKWGNSHAIRLPASVVEALDPKKIQIADRRLPGVARRSEREELLKRPRAFRGRLPAEFRFDRAEANAR